ncbi:MAG: MGMT family protein [Candidatus Melainabacteria bacterium]|nr:MGMT family protein [Candidatus Melainabacteria bacterium]MBI3309065.1 MGMT family protein [Candidatus Melainabacteria bacterium]
MHTYQKVYNLVNKIPKGKVSTYGQIGQMLGLNPRVVGWALNRLAKYKPQADKKQLSTHTSYLNADNVPWQRVINSKGGISTNKLLNIPLGLQQRLLEKEGIKFNSQNKIALEQYLWKRSE